MKCVLARYAAAALMVVILMGRTYDNFFTWSVKKSRFRVLKALPPTLPRACVRV